jgi:hypothetical protein
MRWPSWAIRRRKTWLGWPRLAALAGVDQRTDSDFDVKLIDVFPDAGSTPGYQLLVRGEPMRAKFRKSLSQPEAMLPDQVTPLNFDMPNVTIRFCVATGSAWNHSLRNCFRRRQIKHHDLCLSWSWN